MDPIHLHARFEAAAKRWPDRVAVQDTHGGRLTYGELARTVDDIAAQLRERGVKAGDRVAFYLDKSVVAVAAMYGILATGAAYVPLDPQAPMERNGWILQDIEAAALIVDPRFEADLQAAMAPERPCPPRLLLDSRAELRNGFQATWQGVATTSARSKAPDLAYVLYTSGSTGRPKGVMLNHRNAHSFLDWCERTFEPTPEDRFSSHAPLHFDLSILDVHLPLGRGARVVLIDPSTAKDPRKLAPCMAQQRLTVWYSAPTSLASLAQFGRLGNHDLSSLRLVLFAGEVFPIKHLRALNEQLPAPRYFNLYGPTETNVCTFFEIPREIERQRQAPFPIGNPCEPLEIALLGDDGILEGPNQGELLVRGDAVTAGYWNLPQQTADAFWQDPQSEPGAASWYRTGDQVERDEDGLHHFLGRRDRMVKRRGYRIELDEIEACLYRHDDVAEAAVVAHEGQDGVRIEAILCPLDGVKLSVLTLRQFVLGHLPSYMMPDRFRVETALPRTSTDKVDYQALLWPQTQDPPTQDVA